MGWRADRKERGMTEGCPLCGRLIELTLHHYIPKCLHSSNWFKNHCTKEDRTKGIDICRLCHDGIHDLYTEKELGRTINTKELIMADERIKKHCAWVSKQK